MGTIVQIMFAFLQYISPSTRQGASLPAKAHGSLHQLQSGSSIIFHYRSSPQVLWFQREAAAAAAAAAAVDGC